MNIAPHTTLPSIRLLNETSSSNDLAVSQNLLGEKLNDFKAASSLENLFTQLDNSTSLTMATTANTFDLAVGKFSLFEANIKKAVSSSIFSKTRPSIHVFDNLKTPKSETNEPSLVKKFCIDFLQKCIDFLKN